MRERVVQFGTTAKLVGILTEPPANVPAAGKPGIVLLNSGILHRVGSCRFHVKMARTLSPLGYSVLRFDYSGIGDSEPRRDSLSFEESAVVETREAMDYLAKRGITEFVLIGLCSGADMGHETALADPRVRGLVMIDAWAYRNRGWFLHHYGRKLLQPAAWANWIRVRWNRLRGRAQSGSAPVVAGEGVEYEMPKYVRVFPPRERIAGDLKTFVQRDLRMFFVFTGGLPEYNHRGQYRATFPEIDFGTRIREEHLPDADHILTGLHHQEWLVNQVAGWLGSASRS